MSDCTNPYCLKRERAERAERERDEARAALAELRQKILDDHGKQLWAEVLADEQAIADAKRGREQVTRGETVPLNETALRTELAKAKAENERLTEIAEQHEAELAFWKPGLAAWKVLTAPSNADLEAIVGCVVSLGLREWRFDSSGQTTRDPDAGDARTILSAVADLARAKETTP